MVDRLSHPSVDSESALSAELSSDRKTKSMVTMIDENNFVGRQRPPAGAMRRLFGLCLASFLLIAVGCEDSATPSDDRNGQTEAATEIAAVPDDPLSTGQNDIAGIRDSSGKPPQRPTLDPMEIIQQNDLDHLLGFLYWERDPNWRDDRDLSLLARAATIGRVEMVQTLIQYGADVDLPVRVNNTALHWAVRGGHLETAELLLANGANPNVMGGPDRTMTPMQVAQSNGQQAMIDLLIRYGAEP